MAFSVYNYGFCLCLCIQQGNQGDPGHPGPPGLLQLLNGSDARGETTAEATLFILIELFLGNRSTVLLDVFYLKKKEIIY